LLLYFQEFIDQAASHRDLTRESGWDECAADAQRELPHAKRVQVRERAVMIAHA
jgi:hypothetical protein